MIYAFLVYHYTLDPLLYGNHPHPVHQVQGTIVIDKLVDGFFRKAIRLMQVFSPFFLIFENQEANPFFEVIFLGQNPVFLEVTVISSLSFLGVLSSIYRILHSLCLSYLQTRRYRTCYSKSYLQRLFVRAPQVTCSFDLR